jgi:hypothetical protein
MSLREFERRGVRVRIKEVVIGEFDEGDDSVFVGYKVVAEADADISEETVHSVVAEVVAELTPPVDGYLRLYSEGDPTPKVEP